jgi:ABC-2 type transport system permease protein
MECNMQREGSALHGLGVVFIKEVSDHLTSVRMRILEWLIVFVGVASVYGAISQIREVTAEDPFLLLKLFTTQRDQVPSFIVFMTFLVPMIAIGLGFDSINSEFNRRTLSRILAQPIYRDALLFGKFFAGLFTLSISLVALWLIVVGLGLATLGVPPSTEEIARAFIFLLVVITYAGVWLALAMLFSIIFRSAATAALVTLGLWLFLTLIWPSLADAIGGALSVAGDEETQILTKQYLQRLSPSTLFTEVVVTILNPSTRSLGPIYFSQLQGAILGAPLPLSESMIIAWPQMVGMIASMIVVFVIGYVIFQRQEVRA